MAGGPDAGGTGHGVYVLLRAGDKILSLGRRHPMDRRRKTRHDVQLTCYVDAGHATAIPEQAFTENVSRTGVLMRWLKDVPLPVLDSVLVLDILLPEKSEFGQRLLRCSGSVVRVDPSSNGPAEVALSIQRMRFVKPARLISKHRKVDLAAMPLATERVI